MIAFDVSLNGRHLAVAGADDLCVLTLLIDAMGRCGPEVHLESAHEAETLVTFSVGGMRSGLDSEEGSVDWVSLQTLNIGDVVTVRVVDTDAPSPNLGPLKQKLDETKWHTVHPTQLLGFEVRTKNGRHHLVGRKDLFQIGFDLCATGTLGAKSLGVASQREGRQAPKSDITLLVIGVTKQKDQSSDEYLYWADHEKIEIGEEFTIAVCDIARAHEPQIVESKKAKAG